MNLADAVRYWARRDPERLSLVMRERRLTWGEFDQRTSRLAQGLRQLGVHEGDRVATLLENCVEFCETVVASFKLGAIVVPLNYRLAPPEIADILGRSGASVIVGARHLLDGLDTVPTPGLRARIVVGSEPSSGALGYDEVVDGAIPDDPNVFVEPSHPALICYTSGTTGLPKGATLSHRNILATVQARVLCEGWDRDDVGFIPYAIAFTGGLVCKWMPLYVSGATTVLEPTFEPGRALEVIREWGVTVFIAVPTVLAAMAAHPDFVTTDLTGMKSLATGGALVTEELLTTYQRAGIPLSQQYGLTEGGGLSLVLPGEDALTKRGSTGRVLINTQVRIVDDAGQECPPDTVGELLVRAPQVMEGYWDDPEATATTLVNGWLHTGDLASMDRDGYVYIVDRKKDMLISGGINIYPAEIERVLAEMSALAESAVIGMPDQRWGEVPAVIARLSPGFEGTFTVDELLAICRSRLGSYKVPKQVYFQDDPLPRGMSGKVLKRVLRERYVDAPS